jgi:hypothetical protein
MLKCKIEIVPSHDEPIEDVKDLAGLAFGDMWEEYVANIHQDELSPNQLPQFTVSFHSDYGRDEFLKAYDPGSDHSIYYTD